MSQADRHEAAAAVVVFEERLTRSGHRLGIATLNFEKTLNSLSLEMIQLLAPALADWRDRNDIVAVLLRGAGDRAFCAGGDIQALYRSMSRNHAAGRQIDDYPDRFFAAEYRLDHAIHCYPKPVICFGHGVVMGGGLGLFSAARFRLVTPRSRIAMPEVTIGLFPDAGASWILKGLPAAYGVFLGMTGTHMNAADALHIGLATHAIGEDGWPQLVTNLSAIQWQSDAADLTAIDRAIAACAQPVLADSVLAAHRSVLEAQFPALPANLAETVARLRQLAGQDVWLDRGLATLDSGCPASIGIVYEQLRRVVKMSLAEAFRMELCLATHCARNPDFSEGVRALIIDKDNKPAWQFGRLADLPDEYVQGLFVAPWTQHPLATLGEQ